MMCEVECVTNLMTGHHRVRLLEMRGSHDDRTPGKEYRAGSPTEVGVVVVSRRHCIKLWLLDRPAQNVSCRIVDHAMDIGELVCAIHHGRTVRIGQRVGCVVRAVVDGKVVEAGWVQLDY